MPFQDPGRTALLGRPHGGRPAGTSAGSPPPNCLQLAARCNLDLPGAGGGALHARVSGSSRLRPMGPPLPMGAPVGLDRLPLQLADRAPVQAAELSSDELLGRDLADEVSYLLGYGSALILDIPPPNEPWGGFLGPWDLRTLSSASRAYGCIASRLGDVAAGLPA